jgi:hypothetical protein
MPKLPKTRNNESDSLKGWQQIATDFAEGAAFRMTDLGSRIRKLRRTSGSGAAQIKAA